MAFFLTGFVFATWAARIPARRADLGLSDLQLATALFGLNAGAVVGLQLAAWVVTRTGSRRALLVGLPAFAVLLVPIAAAPGLPGLALALAGSAVANSVVDVALNDQGVGIQVACGRSVLTGMHAMHSLGGVVGGAAAAGAAALGVGVAPHFVVAAGTVAATAVVTNRMLLAPRQLHPEHHGRSRRICWRSGWTARLLVLGAAAFVFTLAEGSALDWSAVLLAGSRHTGPGVAAAGLAVFQATVTLGRLVGDRVIDRCGAARVFAAGTLLAGGGFAGGLLLGTSASAIVGLGLLGLGLATLLPISITAAGTGSRLPVPVVVARVSTLGYLGSFTGPALIGLLAHHSSVPDALLLPALALLATVTAVPVIRARAAALHEG